MVVLVLHRIKAGLVLLNSILIALTVHLGRNPFHIIVSQKPKTGRLDLVYLEFRRAK